MCLAGWVDLGDSAVEHTRTLNPDNYLPYSPLTVLGFAGKSGNVAT